MSQQIKIGLLIDDKKLININSDLCNWIQKNTNLSIELLIINGNKKTKLNRVFFLFKKYSLIRIIEKVIFRVIVTIERKIVKLTKTYRFKDFNIIETLDRFDNYKKQPQFIWLF